MKALAAALVVLASGTLAPAVLAQPQSSAPPRGKVVSLPGLRYEVLASGPAGGAHPTRADTIAMKYVGRLSTSEIFSTSPENGDKPAEFKVSEVIPGMSAVLQLMRVGDHWHVTMPAYLAYGAAGRKQKPSDKYLRRDIPPDATLGFDVELTAVTPGR
jgi:FKBP-type peptidyl-prolyl cis-trans isomerase